MCMHGLKHLFLFLHHFLNLVSHVMLCFSLEMSLECSTSLKTCSKILLELCSLLYSYNNLSTSVFSCNIIAGTFLNVWIRDISLLLANFYWFCFVSRIQSNHLRGKNTKLSSGSKLLYVHYWPFPQQISCTCVLATPSSLLHPQQAISHMLLYVSILPSPFFPQLVTTMFLVLHWVLDRTLHCTQ